MTAAARSDAVPDDGSASFALATGIAVFGGIMLATLGIFQFLQGLSAVRKDAVFAGTPHYFFDFNLTTWGWIHMVIGVIAVGVGISVVLGRTWGYSIGLLVAVLSAISSFAFMPYYPVWGAVLLAFDIIVIWALCRLMMSIRTEAELQIAHEMASRQGALRPMS